MIDPHGSLVEETLRFDLFHKQPSKLVYLHPRLDDCHRLGINPFYKPVVPYYKAELYASRWTFAFLKLLGSHTLSMQMETLLKPVLTALFNSGYSDFTTLKNCFTAEADDNNFQKIIGKASPVIQDFLQQAFHDPRYNTTKSSIYTRLQHFMNYGVLHDLFNGQQTLDIQEELQQ